MSIAASYPEVESAIGVHPWYIGDTPPAALEAMRPLLEAGAAAVGEIGLDRRVSSPPFELQEEFFTRQLCIAREMRLPVIVHCRSAYDDLARILKKNRLPDRGGVILAFSGSAETAAEMIKLGFSFSIGGSMTWKLSGRRRDGIKFIFPDHFLLETDSPDFLPTGIEGEFNEPANIVHNLRAASCILDRDEDYIAGTSTANAERIFRLDIK
jgi:TatD DNase family protein